MARYIGPKSRLSRREGINLLLQKKCAFDTRNYPPGDHGALKKAKLSNYGIQLREKQKVRRLYGILEKQFRGYYAKAASTKGVTGLILLQLLERRLDNVVYRTGFATTRAQARQYVSHGKVLVNDRKVNIASYSVKVGDEIILNVKDKLKDCILNNIEFNKDHAKVSWITVDEKHLKAKIGKLPERDDINFPINEQLIIELYSK